MRKAVTIAAAFGLSFVMITGCGKGENKHTYRDAGIEALNTGDYEGAVTAFDQAIEKSKGLVGAFDIDVLKYRAEAEYLLKDYQAAADTYSALIQVDKELPEYYNLRCQARALTGDYTGAMEDYKRSAELDTDKNAPGRLQALLAAGSAMEAQGAKDEAMALYEAANSEGIQNAELFNRMGLCKFEEKDYDAAISYYSQGLTMEDASSVPELMYNQAVAYEYKGEFTKARELMEQYLSAAGNDEEAERELEFLKTR